MAITPQTRLPTTESSNKTQRKRNKNQEKEIGKARDTQLMGKIQMLLICEKMINLNERK